MSTFEILLLIFVPLLFAIGIFILIWYLKSRSNKEYYDIVTKDGIKIKNSEFKLEAVLVENWTRLLVTFWNEKKNWNIKEIYSVLKNVKVKLYDELYLERSGIKVNAIYWPSSLLVEIATLKDNKPSAERVKSLFRHEVSHIICEKVGKIDGGKFGENHHKLFKEVGLKA